MSEPRTVYVASRASIPERAAMWRRLRAGGWPIISSWIDEDGPGQTADFAELWARIKREIAGSFGLVLYAEADDFPLKGALVEVGMAIATDKPVVIVLPGVAVHALSGRPVGSWIKYDWVEIKGSVEEAFEWLGIEKGASVV